MMPSQPFTNIPNGDDFKRIGKGLVFPANAFHWAAARTAAYPFLSKFLSDEAVCTGDKNFGASISQYRYDSQDGDELQVSA